MFGLFSCQAIHCESQYSVHWKFWCVSWLPNVWQMLQAWGCENFPSSLQLMKSNDPGRGGGGSQGKQICASAKICGAGVFWEMMCRFDGRSGVLVVLWKLLKRALSLCADRTICRLPYDWFLGQILVDYRSVIQGSDEMVWEIESLIDLPSLRMTVDETSVLHLILWNSWKFEVPVSKVGLHVVLKRNLKAEVSVRGSVFSSGPGLHWKDWMNQSSGYEMSARYCPVKVDLQEAFPVRFEPSLISDLVNTICKNKPGLVFRV